MINIGIIGCGSITKLRHAPEYTANKASNIKGFFDTMPERAAGMVAQFGGSVYGSIDEMLADKEIDAVSVCAANIYHAPITIKALKAGKHVLCEKPMATSVEDCMEMVEASKKAGKILMIGHSQRFVPAHVKAKEILDSGELGNILSFSSTFGHSGPETWSADKSAATWFFKKDVANLGVIGDLGIHKIDLIRWLIGDRICEIQAVMATLDKKDESGKKIEVDDNSICIMKSQKGIVGTVTASWSYYGEEDNSTVIHCSKGAVKICKDKDYPVIVEKKNKERVYYKVGNIQTNDNQTSSGIIDSFVRSVVNGEMPEVSGTDGLEAMRIVFACVESANKGIVVKI